MIIEIRNTKFILMDPKKHVSPKLEESFNSWTTYYKSRSDHQTINWSIQSLTHPIQTDDFNCGIFVINFIKSYILNSNCQFEATKTTLECDRQLISSAIEQYKQQVE